MPHATSEMFALLPGLFTRKGEKSCENLLRNHRLSLQCATRPRTLGSGFSESRQSGESLAGDGSIGLASAFASLAVNQVRISRTSSHCSGGTRDFVLLD